MKRLTTINKNAPNEFNVLALYGIDFNIKNKDFSIERVPVRELLLADGRWGVSVEYLEDYFRDPEELRHLSIFNGGVFVKDAALEIPDECQLKAWDIISHYYESVLRDQASKFKEKLLTFLDEDTLLPLPGFTCEIADMGDIGWAIRASLEGEFAVAVVGASQSLAYAAVLGKDKVIELNTENLETGKTVLPPIESFKDEE